MSFIHPYRSLLLVLALVGLLIPAATQAQGRGGGGRGGGASSPGGGGGGGARAGGGAPAGPVNGGPGPGGPGNGVRAGGPGPGGPGRPGYGYGGGYYPGYGARTAVYVGSYYYQPYWAFGLGWGYPYYGYYGYPYAPYFGYPYPYYGYGYGTYDSSAALRLDVTPRETQVFIDGYVAGTVNDFDGVFQRLRLPPGGHKVTLYLEGYRTVTQSLFLAAASDQKITYKLEPLQPGETSEPPPVAEEPASDEPQMSTEFGVSSAGGPPAPREPGRPSAPREPAAPRQPNGTFGTLSIRVLPSDAEILVDGERWAAPEGQGRIAIQLSDGRHHVEVRKEGFALYQEDVLIRRGATMTLNVSLLRGIEEGR